MPKPKGGRGVTAPYESKLVRVPLPIVDQVSELIDRYQEFIASGGVPLSPPVLLDAISNNKLVNELSELKHLRKSVAYQEGELNQIHALNGDLNLQIQELQEQLKGIDKAINELVEEVDKPVNELVEEVNKPVNELVEEVDKPVNELELSGAELGRRLGYRDHSYVLRQAKSKADFTDWSRAKDPNNIGWQYDPESKLFSPKN